MDNYGDECADCGKPLGTMHTNECFYDGRVGDEDDEHGYALASDTEDEDDD